MWKAYCLTCGWYGLYAQIVGVGPELQRQALLRDLPIHHKGIEACDNPQIEVTAFEEKIPPADV